MLDKNIVDLIRQTDHGKGASDEEIHAAQTALGLRFTEEYKEFLRRFGWMDARGDYFYGLGADAPHHLDLVIMTKAERHDVEPQMPPHLLPLLNNGGGNHWCIDCSAGDHFGRVVYWDHEVGDSEPLEVVAPDYATWLLERLTETMSAPE